MTSLKVISDRCADNALTVTVRIPARRNGDANVACLARVIGSLHDINPDAFDADRSERPAAQLAVEDGHTADGGGIVLDAHLSPEVRAAMLRAECATGNCDE